MRKDFRTPADPQDFETTMSRAATPVQEFSVRASGNDLVVEILEARSTPGRGGNTGYRILFAPTSLLPARELEGRLLGAIADLSDTVVYVSANNDGGRQRVTVANRAADRGWYLCMPVGQRGMTATPTGVVRSPWGL